MPTLSRITVLTRILPAATWVAGVLLSGAAALVIRHHEERHAEATFRIIAGDYQHEFKEQTDLIHEEIRSVSRLFLASSSVDQAEFELFTGSSLQVHPGICELAYAELATAGDADPVLFAVSRDPTRSETDIATLNAATLLCEGTADFGRGGVFSTEPALEPATGSASTCVIHPIPDKAPPSAIVAHIDIGQTLEHALQVIARDAPGGIDIYLEARADDDSFKLVYQHASRSRGANDPPPPLAVARTGVIEEQALTAFGREYRVTCAPTPRLLTQGLTRIPLVLFVTGTLNSLLIAALVLAASSRARALTRARDEANAATRAKSQFLANVSHELRTPLNGVVGIADLLAGTALDAEQRDLLNTIRGSSSVLSTLVDDLIDVSRASVHCPPLAAETMDVRRTFHDAVALLQPKARGKGLDLRLEIDDDVPRIGTCHPTRLQRVLIHLVDNAIKFTTQGSVRVQVSRTTWHGAPAVTVSVADTGPGVSEEQRTRLFQPFAQDDASLTRTGGGLGLGLAIAHRLVERMGGTLELATAAAPGATFTCTLPLGTPADPPAASPAPGAPAAQARILVVEDNPINQRVTRRTLENAGHVVDVANDGAEALVALERNPYDLVLMDCQMPVMDGLEATRRIRASEMDGHLPILALTAHCTDDDRAQCASAGMDDFLTKPIAPAALYAAVERWLRTNAPATAGRTGAGC